MQHDGSFVKSEVESDLYSHNNCYFVSATRELDESEINTLKQKAKLYAVADKEKINKIWDELSGNVDIFEYFYRLIILIRPKLEAGLSREQRLVNRYIRKQLSLLGKKEDEVYNPLFEALKKAGIPLNEEAQKALEDDAIENIIVLIDDLDRCQPDRIIETLEAIKLFLSVEKMTFIIAADENVIQYAIRKKYPPIENYTVNLDKEYIEKIIQLPIYIPELSSKDIENYLMFLVVQEYCPKEQFKAFLEKIKKEKLLISDDVIDVQKIKEKAMDFIGDENKRKFEETVDVIAGIKAIVAGNLKGNPRQTKRFLNTYITKKKLAELYFGTDEGALDTRVLAKLLVLQKLDNDLFIQLNE